MAGAEVSETVVQPEGSRGRALPPQGEGGYDACWYPVARSDELAPQQVVGRDFLDGRIVVFRGASGRPVVTSAYCRHLGADLSVGDVVADRLRCAFHHWCYDADGACVEIPSGDAIPQGTRLFRFPVAEQLGLIWAYNGARAEAELPRFVTDDEQLIWRVAEARPHPVDPWTLLTNSVDFQHLRVVHGLEVSVDVDAVKFGAKTVTYDVTFTDPKLGTFEQRVRVFGSNVITLSGTMMGAPLMTMFAGTPQPDRTTRGWVVTATHKGGGSSTNPSTAQLLEMGEKFFLALIEEDTPIMNTIRFRADTLVPADRVLGQFFEYLRRFPRAHPAREFIR